MFAFDACSHTLNIALGAAFILQLLWSFGETGIIRRTAMVLGFEITLMYYGRNSQNGANSE